MTNELRDKVWMLLPKEYREEIKQRMWYLQRIDSDDYDTNFEISMLCDLFGKNKFYGHIEYFHVGDKVKFNRECFNPYWERYPYRYEITSIKGYNITLKVGVNTYITVDDGMLISLMYDKYYEQKYKNQEIMAMIATLQEVVNIIYQLCYTLSDIKKELLSEFPELSSTIGPI